MKKDKSNGISIIYDKTEVGKRNTAYVSEHEWNQVFDAETALLQGTVFPELLRPFQYNEKLNNDNY